MGFELIDELDRVREKRNASVEKIDDRERGGNGLNKKLCLHGNQYMKRCDWRKDYFVETIHLEHSFYV